MTDFPTASSVPIPPVGATEKTIPCEYCPVACGYKVYTWPLGEQGGTAAADNALGVDLPTTALSGRWISENMHTVTLVDGEMRNCVILPDPDTQVVNVGGTHSVRGGALAKKLYNPNGPTSDRLLHPMLRVNGVLMPISWDMATDLVAEISQYVLDTHDEMAWGMKIYSYQFYQNVFAGSKLAFDVIGTPNYSPHHAPADGDDVPGLSDVGIDAFSAAFADDRAADVLFISGADPYETKSVRFTTWQSPAVDDGATLIYVDPRKTFTAAYAESKGGLHLQLKPGTDTALYMAIARVIVEEGWQDDDFIGQAVASRADLDNPEEAARRRAFGQTFEEFSDWVTSTDAFSLGEAEAITGVPADKIRRAAEIITGGSGEQPKTTILFEKGVYWSHNYENTAAIGNLGLLTGATGREGRATSRMGGHQRGGQKGASYPKDKSPESHDYIVTVDGEEIRQKQDMDTERWFYEGNTRFRWIVGTNWLSAMGATAAMRNKLVELRAKGPEITSADYDSALAAMKGKVDAGGIVIVHSEIYLNESTDYADLILPAAAWGEEDYARNNAERRLRIYEKIADPPGEALPDWRIFQMVAQKMGAEGFDWEESNDIFELAAERSAGGRRDFAALVEKAKADGKKGMDFLREFGNEGLQTPLKMGDDGELIETVRQHADLTTGKTKSGKFNFILADWDAVAARNAILAPDTSKGEIWVSNGRNNALWNNLFDNARRTISMERWPANFLEIHPDDAAERGIETGDWISIENDDVLDPLGNKTTGSFTAVAYVSDIVQPGVTYSYFLYPGQPANTVTPGDSSLQPLNLRYNFKLGKGVLRNLGPSGLEATMSFAPRNIPPS